MVNGWASVIALQTWLNAELLENTTAFGVNLHGARRFKDFFIAVENRDMQAFEAQQI